MFPFPPKSLRFAPRANPPARARASPEVATRDSRAARRRPEVWYEPAVTQSFSLVPDASCSTLSSPVFAVLRHVIRRRRRLSASMNGIVRSGLRATALRGVLSSCGSNGGSQGSARALWNICGRRQTVKVAPRSLVSSPELRDLRARRCYSKSHTKGTDPPTRVSCRVDRTLNVSAMLRVDHAREKEPFHSLTAVFELRFETFVSLLPLPPKNDCLIIFFRSLMIAT